MLTINLSDQALAALTTVADDFNASTGQTLTVADWVALHLREIAIGAQLRDEETTIKRDVDHEVARRIAARRRELLDALDKAP
jgi:hypothetical protein